MTTATQQEFAPELDPRDYTELQKLIGHEVVDKNEVNVGTVDSIWEDSTGEPAFITVKTGWFGLGKTLIVPTISAHIRPIDQKIRVPYSEQVLKEAPTFDSDQSVDLQTERNIYNYYAQHGLLVPAEYPIGMVEASYPPIPDTQARPAMPPPLPVNTQLPPLPPTGIEENNILLHKEKLVVGKRDAVTEGVRLKKIVRSEVASVSVELLHEELVIDRVSVARPVTTNTKDVFKEEEIYIPLRREVVVIGKETVVTEEVHAGKESFIEKKDISDTVRSEDVELVDERHLLNTIK